MIYNEDRKRQFIRENNNFIDTLAFEKRMLWIFSDIAKAEEFRQQDCCDFSVKEILDFYKSLFTFSYDRLLLTNTYLKTYCYWCMKNGYVEDGFNHYEEVSTDMLGTCIDKGIQKDYFVRRDELIAAAEHFYNACEQVLVVGLYEGLTYPEMNVLTLEHVDTRNKVVRIPGGRTLSISPELTRYIEASANEYTKYDRDGNPVRQSIFDPTDDHVIKHLTKKSAATSRVVQFQNMMRRCKTEYDKPWIHAAELKQSGAANMLLEYYLQEKGNGKTVSEVARAHLEEIRSRYGQYWQYDKRFSIKYGFLYE